MFPKIVNTSVTLFFRTVLELLQSYTRPDVAMDSNARYPPPTCHPETRLPTRNKFKDWVYSTERQWNIMWVRGPAGTGKLAVAQRFAECCVGCGRFGAAYFFSRTGNRNKSETVIPSLAHQLAVAFPEYKFIIAAELANNPDLLFKAPPAHFRSSQDWRLGMSSSAQYYLVRKTAIEVYFESEFIPMVLFCPFSPDVLTH